MYENSKDYSSALKYFLTLVNTFLSSTENEDDNSDEEPELKPAPQKYLPPEL